MKVLVEARRGCSERTRFDEVSLRGKSRHTLRAAYPYEYGFVVDSSADGGDCLDCFILSNREHAVGELVECEPVDVFVLREGSEEDVKLLAVVAGEEPVEGLVACHARIAAFLVEAFREWPDLRIEVGPLLGPAKAREYAERASRST